MFDFVELAMLMQDVQHRALSSSQSNNGDDDFAKMESDTNVLYQENGAAAYETATASAVGINGGISSTPFFSKTAEAELYLLATNFLLYIAMVIITIMVAKIYFPELLERGDPVSGANNTPRRSTTTTRPSLRNNFSYLRVSIFSDKTNNGNDATATDDEVLYSDDSQEDYDDDDSYPSDDDEDDDDDLMLGEKRKRVLEFDQEQTSRAVVLRRLLFCCLMLNVTFVTWGALQERMLTRRYPRHTGDYFTYSYALVFTNRFWTLIMSGMLLCYLKPRASRSTVIYEYSFPSISNMLSSWCQYEALRYVSFPATTLFKSFKLAPVMLMGKLLGNKTYPAYDYLVALIIGVGIALFMSSTDDLSFSSDYLGNVDGFANNTKWTGVMLLCLFLFFDSFTSQFQSRMFQRHVDLSMVELMFATSAYSTVLSAITLVHTHELYPALEFVIEHSEIHLHFFMFSICSTIGQLFIFYTIKNFGAVVFTLIMTTRVLLSIALSCVMYGHQISGTGFVGLMIVLGAVLYRIRRKAQGTQLIKWQGMEDDKGPELVQEWHEHVDM